MTDWRVAIYALAEIGDRRALPRFREAALWGAKHREQEMLEYGVRGLGKTPVRENLECFARILAALPRGTDGIGHYGTEYALLALTKHEFRDAVPLFVSQLDHPAKYNRALARRGLTRLVGEDLGAAKEPWLRRYENARGEPER